MAITLGGKRCRLYPPIYRIPMEATVVWNKHDERSFAMCVSLDVLVLRRRTAARCAAVMGGHAWFYCPRRSPNPFIAASRASRSVVR